MDVAVDLRQDSPTYGKYFSIILSSDNQTALYIPKGCAHGFFTLEDDSVVAYKVDSPYTPEAEGGLFWDDPVVGITWPRDIAVSCLSDKDSTWPMLADVAPVQVY